MAVYKVVGSYEEFYEATIEAPDEDTAIQIFYQNSTDMTVQDGNWNDIRIDDYLDDDEPAEYTVNDYNENGVEILV
jgi:hypothetical protein